MVLKLDNPNERHNGMTGNLPPETWIAIGLHVQRRSDLNSLTRTSKFLLGLLRPTLYRVVDLRSREINSKSPLSTIKLLAKGDDVSRWVQEFHSRRSVIDDAERDNGFQVLMKAISNMHSLRCLDVSCEIFRDELEQDQFFGEVRARKEVLLKLQIFDWDEFELNNVENYNLVGLEELHCTTWSPYGFISKSGLFKIIYSSMATLQSLVIPLEMVGDNSYDFWQLRFPALKSIRTGILSNFNRFIPLGPITAFCHAHIKAKFHLCSDDYHDDIIVVNFTEVNGALMCRSVNTDPATFCGIVLQFYEEFGHSLTRLTLSAPPTLRPQSTPDGILSEYINTFKDLAISQRIPNPAFPVLRHLSISLELKKAGLSFDCIPSDSILEVVQKASLIGHLSLQTFELRVESKSFNVDDLTSALRCFHYMGINI